MLHAQITTLHLQIPDAPALTKSIKSQTAITKLAHRLRASGLLKADWDPAKHPHWPAGTPGGIGGQFAPTAASDDTVGEEPAAQVIPAQIAIPAPLELPFPLPSEIAPGPLAPPDISPRDIPRNPYPDRPECKEEWASAMRYCWELMENGRMGKDGYRGMGDFSTNALWVKFPKTAAETLRVLDMSNNENSNLVEQPRSPEELLALHKILRSDPQRYLRIANRWLADNPNNLSAYFSRHYGWMQIGEPRRALEDLNKVIELRPTPISFLSRGEVYRHLGE